VVAAVLDGAPFAIMDTCCHAMCGGQVGRLDGVKVTQRGDPRVVEAAALGSVCLVPYDDGPLEGERLVHDPYHRK
jgi:hypothetical protein